MLSADSEVQYLKFSASGWQTVKARVISEAAVSLNVNGQEWLTFMCTPTHLEALAVGFLYNERLIESSAEIASVRPCQSGEIVDVWLNHSVEKPAQWLRTSGCSGGFSRVALAPPSPVSASADPISPEHLMQAMGHLLEAQELYRLARGIHCSALSDGRQIVMQVEDIGRHNTLDKLAGMWLLENVRTAPLVVLSTGRISSEMLQKSARLGTAVVVSRSSPTLRSIELANELGITLIGYARRDQLLVYSHPQHLASYPQA